MSYNMEQIFSSVYKKCTWGSNNNPEYNGSSGDGSSPEYNVEYINFVKNFIKENNINSVVDVGCGDWRLGKTLFYDVDIEYNGYDVYSDLISHLKKEYIKPKFNFIHLDILNDRNLINCADLLIIKDVLQHWDNDTVRVFVDWVTSINKFKFVLVTNCTPNTSYSENDTPIGGWRGLNHETPIFKEKGFLPVLKYKTKEVMLFKQ